ncbi:nucleotidyl transferase AbiEii/AbiGii toxin family protein [Spirosoma sp. BT702]|uniref:Nucleotidyl transferase AbiEii/AbiGii toxin family protein n=1 Tax=Spirosoma profusum TaxID=2771354 RepID=A0A927GAA2_9BACT|nr:nucleotidyl transferase AbiEii/AbiGii toxin family protein [Spirosoma profusum]MBD2704935.1 nucleotidyl transferase AbiEii/AbiGii toxin family protein [Spirosoma profusum]
MILPQTFTRDWLQQVAHQFKKTSDLKLLEKVVRALSLLEQLRLIDLQFVFKGGTSLILHFEQPRRFSIDIDIVMADKPDDLHVQFDKIVSSGAFNRWSNDSDRKSHHQIPVEHYKFYYSSAIDLGGVASKDSGPRFGDEPILLDILYTEPEYPSVIEKPLNHPWLQVQEPILTVQLPDINSLLGDKLTAFAPNTTGILYSKKRPLEVIKQLFDVALLFDQANDLSITQQTFERLAIQEIAYRMQDVVPNDVLNDVIETAFILAIRNPKDERFSFLQEGVKRLNNFIVTDFRIEDAILAGAKAAYLSQLLKTNQTVIERYSHPSQIANWQLTNPTNNRLNKLKKTQPEAFYYWFLAIQAE